MEIIKNELQYDLDIQKYFTSERICFFDIETTGFSRKNNIVYLVGLLLKNVNSNYLLKQYLIQSKDEEKKLLKLLIEDFKYNQLLVNYNGDTFDIPFLNSKYKKHNIDYKIPLNKSFDLYKIVKENRDLLDLKNTKLKTIEKYLGINREDKLSGKECITLFYEYMNNNALDSKKLILKHNYDDLYYLPYTLKILDVIDDKKTIVLPNANRNIDKLILKIKQIEMDNDIFTIECEINPIPIEQIYEYKDSYNIEWNTRKGQLTIQFQIKNSILSSMEKCQYVDLKDFNIDNSITIKDITNFSLPDNIILICIEKKFVFENIKNLLYVIMLNITKKYFL